MSEQPPTPPPEQAPTPQSPVEQAQAGQAPPRTRPPMAAPPGSGWGVVALVLGIASIPLALIPVVDLFTALPLGILAVILGFVARGKVSWSPVARTGPATAGIVTGAIGIVISVLILLGVGYVVSKSDELEQMHQDLRELDQQQGF